MSSSSYNNDNDDGTATMELNEETHGAATSGTEIEKLCCRGGEQGIDHCYFEEIDEECLVHDILCQLPFCTLLKARLACNYLHNVISANHDLWRAYKNLRNGSDDEEILVLFGRNNNNNNDGNMISICDMEISDSTWRVRGWMNRSLELGSGTWRLRAAARGLLVFRSNDGKLAVANALTNQWKLLPDAIINSRLTLSRRLKINDRESIQILAGDAHPLQQDETGYRIVVFHNFQDKFMHVLVYTSATHRWRVTIHCNTCHVWPNRITPTAAYRNKVYGISSNGRYLVSYDVELDALAIELLQPSAPECRRHFSNRHGRSYDVHSRPILVVYGSRVMMLRMTLSLRQADHNPANTCGIRHDERFNYSLPGINHWRSQRLCIWALNQSTHRWSYVSSTPAPFDSTNLINPYANNNNRDGYLVSYDGRKYIWLKHSRTSTLVSYDLSAGVWAGCSLPRNLSSLLPACSMPLVFPKDG